MKRFLIFIGLASLVACMNTDEVTYTIPTVQAYLYPEQQATIQLSLLNETDSLPQYPEDFHPLLLVNEEEYALESLGEGKFRSYEMLPKATGTHFSFSLPAWGINAESIMPEPVGTWYIPEEDLQITTITTVSEARAYQRSIAATLYFDNPEGLPFYYWLEAPESEQYVFSDASWVNAETMGGSLTYADSINIEGRYLEAIGEYEVIMMACNDEFARFYEGSMSQGQLDPNYSNIAGGSGIFTAVHPDTLHFGLSPK